MRLIISVIALLKILQKEKHNNLCSLPHPTRNSAIERLNICYMWLQLQVEAFSACFSGLCVGKVSYPKRSKDASRSGISEDASS